MTTESAALAVVLRRAQWELDEVAHALPRDEVGYQAYLDLAGTLDQLAELVRARAAWVAPVVVYDFGAGP